MANNILDEFEFGVELDETFVLLGGIPFLKFRNLVYYVLSVKVEKDIWSWKEDASHVYTVCSAYNFLFSSLLLGPNNFFGVLLNSIWKYSVLEIDARQTEAALLKKGLKLNGLGLLGPLYSFVEEDYSHLFVSCLFLLLYLVCYFIGALFLWGVVYPIWLVIGYVGDKLRIFFFFFLNLACNCVVYIVNFFVVTSF